MTVPLRMPDISSLRAFVNGRGVDVPIGGTALDAVRLADPAEAAAIEAGTRAIADSRGLPIAGDEAAYGGAIYRTISARAAQRALEGEET
ncbi:MAG: hypothetical protein MUF21_06740 [Gemmatimonadaceae bacterium]|jgi:hypothetical protein|nr:hypothetical protein [Gemmatimonadaceae bacterium]